MDGRLRWGLTLPRPGPGLQVFGQNFQFVQNFGEYGELVSFQGFVEQFRAGGRVVDAVVVLVPILVEVVIFEQGMFSRQPGYVDVGMPADAQGAAEVAGFKHLAYPQHHALGTGDIAAQGNDARAAGGESEGVLKADDEGVFVQSAFVDALVMVEGVPSVGVLARSNFTP